MVYEAETYEREFVEVPTYAGAQFLSDVGGAAGLVLGVSVATVVGLIDCIILNIAKLVIKIFF